MNNSEWGEWVGGVGVQANIPSTTAAKKERQLLGNAGCNIYLASQAVDAHIRRI